MSIWLYLLIFYSITSIVLYFAEALVMYISYRDKDSIIALLLTPIAPIILIIGLFISVWEVIKLALKEGEP